MKKRQLKIVFVELFSRKKQFRKNVQMFVQYILVSVQDIALKVSLFKYYSK